MNVRRSWLFFLVMLIICACAILLLAEKPITGVNRTLRGSPAESGWQVLGAGSGKVAAVAGWRDGALALRYFTTEGTPLSRQTVPLPEELEGGILARLLPVREGLAYLGIYGPNAEKLYLYRVGEKGEAERLLALPCPGASSAERVSATALSELVFEDGVLSFAVRTGGLLDRYTCGEEGGLVSAGTGSCGEDDVLSVYSAGNGTLLVGGAGFLTQSGKSSSASFEGQAVSCLTYGRGGWYYLDAARLEVDFVDAAFTATQRMLSLDTVWQGEPRSLTSVALTREESALMLLDGAILTLTDGEGTRELTGILGAKRLSTWLSLGKYALFALLAAVLFWAVFCGLRNGYASLVIFRGSLYVAAALVCFTLLHFLYLLPLERSAELGERTAVTESALRTVSADERLGEEDLALDVCRVLESGGRNVRVVPAQYREGAWVAADGRLASAVEGFAPALLETLTSAPAETETPEEETPEEPEEPPAEESGEESVPAPEESAPAAETAASLENGIFRYVRRVGDLCLSIRMELPQERDGADLSSLVLIGFGVMTLVMLLILFSIGLDVRRISGKMESISRGGVSQPLELHSGDELESMASMVNSLGQSLKKQEQERESVEHAYRRFVPEKVLALLGKQSIQEVDKSAFAARSMAVMTVWFTFPEALYTDMSSSRLLFDSVNEVIERTASIVTRKGGTVFHFAYNGFDVVMNEGVEAVSTAVAIQQEVLSLNELRTQTGLPAVTLRIALDKGNVMLGIVGDTAQMEPTTISTSLSTAQELIDLCNRLKAGILCTEAIVSEKQDHGIRYMGKCVVGDRPVRVYEVFDGDEFGVRRGKAASLRDFSRGVFDLYGGGTTDAKRTFLQLAHDYPQDGGIRYYLYLADRLEHDPTLPCVLNAEKVGRGEM